MTDSSQFDTDPITDILYTQEGLPYIDLQTLEEQTSWFMESGIADMVILDLCKNPHNTGITLHPENFWFWTEVRQPGFFPDPTLQDPADQAADLEARKSESGYEIVVLAYPKDRPLPTDSSEVTIVCPVSLHYDRTGSGGSEARINRQSIPVDLFGDIIALAGQRRVEDPNFYGIKRMIRC